MWFANRKGMAAPKGPAGSGVFVLVVGILMVKQKFQAAGNLDG